MRVSLQRREPRLVNRVDNPNRLLRNQVQLLRGQTRPKQANRNRTTNRPQTAHIRFP
jgi:hypothetical protein